MPSALKLLTDLSVALESLGLRWYVFGAQAVVVYGRPRLTEDVDVTVELGSMSRDELVNALRANGFEVSDFADDEFIEATRVIPFMHSSGMALDVVLSGPGLEARFLDAAQPVDLGGVEVPVISVEHLLVTKVLAARPKDLADAHDLVQLNDDIDIEAVRTLLTDLEAALGIELLEAVVAMLTKMITVDSTT